MSILMILKPWMEFYGVHLYMVFQPMNKGIINSVWAKENIQTVWKHLWLECIINILPYFSHTCSLLVWHFKEFTAIGIKKNPDAKLQKLNSSDEKSISFFRTEILNIFKF